MQRDENRLREMLDAASQLTVLLTRSDAELQLLQDRVFRHSVFFEFVALGEQVAGLSSEFIGRHPEIPWRQIAAFRNRVAHGYFELSLPIVWQIWSQEIPTLARQIQDILDLEFPTAER